jgi:hypothetical protein
MEFKSLLYGSVAVLVGTGASTGALAADPPIAAEPVEYVRVCDAFGKGFFYIPGTDTCLRISGRVRVQAFLRDNNDADKNTNHFTSYARAYINMDARTETDLGLLRSYFSFRHTFGDRDIDTSDYELDYGTALVVDEAFISLSNDMGQLTVGYTSSFFDFFGGYTFTGNGGHDQTADANLFGYTFNVGNGVSVSLSLEDPYASGRKSAIDALVYGSTATGGTYWTGSIYGGQEIPDIVASLRADQEWGSAQIMGALRQMRIKEPNGGTGFPGSFTATGTIFNSTGLNSIGATATGTAAVTTTAGGGTEWGWAIGAGLEIAVPGMPADFAVQAGYSEGAAAFVTAGTGGPLADAVVDAATGQLVLTEAWQVGAGFNIRASSTVSMNIDGAYGEINHGGVSADYDYWGMAGNIVWRPVSDLSIGAEIQYTETNPEAQAWLVSASDSLTGVVRFQRNF